MLKHIDKNIFDSIFKKHDQKIQVFLRSSKVKGDTYDKFRDTGYTKTVENPYFIRAMVKTVTANTLIIKELGLTETGAMQIIIRNSDVAFVKLSNRIIINDSEYYIYNDAVGNRLQIFPIENFNYSRIVIFRKDK